MTKTTAGEATDAEPTRTPERPQARPGIETRVPSLDVSLALARLLSGPCDIATLADACGLLPSLALDTPALTGSRWRELHDALRAHPAVIVEEDERADRVRMYRLRYPAEPALCLCTHASLLCTLPRGHAGNHEAHGAGPSDVIVAWP